jgi:signal transduction histidine kinase/DNA-binding response OmpR family regulator
MAQILVVDDDPEVARMLVTLLTFHGFEATSADSGERALERLAEQPFQVVLLDVRLPGMNGFEACSRIRGLYGPSLPVMMLTAFGDSAAVRQALAAGADDFLHKPVDTAALTLKVRALLRFKALHDELERNRTEAQARARDLALLHEIGRDWSLIAEPEEFHRMVTQRLARLIGAEICLIALYDPDARTLVAALPACGLPDRVASEMRYTLRPEMTGLWSFRTGRAYVSNRAPLDARVAQGLVAKAGVESVVLVPMLSEGALLGLLVAANKPGGFSDADVQLLSLFAGPAASFLRSRQIFEQQRRHAERLERLAAIVGEMGATGARAPLVSLVVNKVHRELGYVRAAFYALDAEGLPLLELGAGEERPADLPEDPEPLRWAARAAAPLQAAATGDVSELAVPVRAGGRTLGLLSVLRRPGTPFPEEEVNLLSALAGQLAVALDKAASAAETERLARQMATLYDLGLETSALQDLRGLFAKAAGEAGRLIGADHTSVFRLDAAAGELRLFAAWAADPTRETLRAPSFRLGEGVAGRVAAEWQPLMLNDMQAAEDFVVGDQPVARMLCVPLTYFDQESGRQAAFGVLNASRKPGGARFALDDIGYLTRFASQLSIAVTNSMAFAAERERSEQLALVNTLVREIAGNLSRERVLDATVRRLREALRYPAVLIGVADPDARLIRIAAAATGDLRREGVTSYPLEAGVLGRALRERRTVLVPDSGADPEAVVHSAATRSQAAVPVVSGDEAVAVLLVESDRPGAFRRGEVITLETLGDGLGIILRNADLYQALEHTNARLVELDRLKSELINIVAHDFRAPLAGVLGYAELLEWKPSAPRHERVQRARAIRTAAAHMAQMVDKTLKTTRLESGQLAYDFGVTDLGAVLREVAARFPQEPPHPLELDVPDDPLPAWADQDRITEVVENLLSNAAKYSSDGRPIRLEVSREHETATVRVIDHGMGIAASDQSRLFRPFSRVQKPGAARVPGSGLGLYICERIVRAHGGKLGVDSAAGSGSTFWFSLPLFGVAAQTRPPTVLVAVADDATRREVRRVAESLGFDVHESGDGVETIEAAARLVPAAAVLDRVLPHLRAEEVAERLLDSSTAARVPLVVLAAAEDLGAHAALFRACVPKPLDRALLAETLETITTRRPLQGNAVGGSGGAKPPR